MNPGSLCITIKVTGMFATIVEKAHCQHVFDIVKRDGTQATRESGRDGPGTAGRPFDAPTIPNCLKSPKVLTDGPHLPPLGMSLLSQGNDIEECEQRERESHTHGEILKVIKTGGFYTLRYFSGVHGKGKLGMGYYDIGVEYEK
ncbi:hypothetical protein LAZ67_10002232 [Cordylochernes scorpioides]|uniref:Uncharacterized protein n=1 Tax=Cordylochernes scorpioides TaxID=51811 RepID=A0ABY6KWH9_9ARAC|nr:hypothetical protein LAZ67_10002232 [Cordylochernes scorpioides]